MHDGAVGQHDLGLEQVVDREAAGAGDVPDPAAQGQPADAGGADDAAGNGAADLVRGGVDVLPDAAAADPHRAGGGIDVDAVDPGQVDDDAVIDDAQAAAVVAAAADCDQRVLRAGEADHRRHVGG